MIEEQAMHDLDGYRDRAGALSSFLETARACVKELDRSIKSGNTFGVRKSAEKLGRSAVELDLPVFLPLAECLKRSTIECSLGNSLECVDRLKSEIEKLSSRIPCTRRRYYEE